MSLFPSRVPPLDKTGKSPWISLSNSAFAGIIECMEKKNTNTKYWIFGSIAFLVLVIALVASTTYRPKSAVQTFNETYTDLGFDTPITFQATCTEAEFEKYESILKSTFVDYNKIFDQYDEYEGVNNVYTLNQEAYDHPVEVPKAMIECLDMAIRAGEMDERFDISEGKVLTLWHDAREADTPYVPKDADIQAARQHEGIAALAIDHDKNTVAFTDPNLKLDLGAIAKGYTAGVCAKRLHEAGLDNGYINAGGNVVLLGEKPDGKDWVIGIQSPDQSPSVVQFVTRRPVVMVTSGDYQRYMEVDGKRYSHIIDPTTGYPAAFMRSVTVIADADQSAWADAMSTTLFCMRVEDGMKFCEDNALQAVWITDKEQSVPGLEPDFKTPQYNIYCTPGLKDALKLTM